MLKSRFLQKIIYIILLSQLQVCFSSNKSPSSSVQSSTVAVIIQFNDELSASSTQNITSKTQYVLDQIQKAKSNTLKTHKLRDIKQFKYVPMIATSLSKDELALLKNDPSIKIYEDTLKKPFLSQSVKRVYSNQNSSVYHGNNEWAVAVLDTGVSKSHSFLSNKVISEACYSDGGGQIGTDSLCPAGAIASTAVNSGLPCNIEGCEHGTQVAGVSAGNAVAFDGVARDAKIISIQVYSQVNSEAFCFPDTSCLGAYTSDIIKGLERVFELRNTFKIAAVNVSLGSAEVFSGTCDDQPEKPIIDSLKAVNIAVVAATGNNGNTTQMSSPACISSTIAVAATNDTNDSTWSNNNISDALDIFAPGVNITSSSSNGGFIADTGTSLATPHISGALAVLRHAAPSLSVNQVIALIKRHGPLITQNSVSRRRLDLSSILKELFPQQIDTAFLPAVYHLLLD